MTTLQEISHEPVIALATLAHEGIFGLDGKPLLEHSLRIMASQFLVSAEQKMVAALHDAGTATYSVLELVHLETAMIKLGCSLRVIAAVKCFSRPPDQHWTYSDWISFMKRDELTRLTKLADTEDAIKHFGTHAAPTQLAAWKRTRDQLSDSSPEPATVTERIAQSMTAWPMPDLTLV